MPLPLSLAFVSGSKASPPFLRVLAGLPAAVVFLTRFPLPRASRSAATIAESAWAFPLVGAAIGLSSGLVFVLARAFHLGAAAAALLALLAGFLLTGAMHEDGLADTADGLGGGRDREEALAIMRDSRLGTYGVAAISLSIGLRAAALSAIAAPIPALSALLAAHAVSRALLPLAALALPPARKEGQGAAFAQKGLLGPFAAAALALLFALAALGPVKGFLGLGLAGLFSLAVGALARRRIGGYTGDVLGAMEQVGEIAMLLLASVR